MRKIALSLAALAFAAPALASDLPSRKSAPLAPVAQTNWTGAYAGIQAGFVWGNSPATVIATGDAGALSSAANIVKWTAQPYYLPGVAVLNDAGAIVGGQIGYNYQIGSLFIVGVEGDLGTLIGAEHTQTFVSPASTLGLASYSQIGRTADWVGSAVGRAGFLITPNLLAFVDGGVAFGHANASIGTWSNALAATYAAPNLGSLRTGWTAGGGVEWMFAPNWSAKLEYRHFDLGSATLETGAISANGPYVGTQGILVNAKFRGNLVKAGINYHFNWSPTALTLN